MKKKSKQEIALKTPSLIWKFALLSELVALW